MSYTTLSAAYCYLPELLKHSSISDIVQNLF